MTQGTIHNKDKFLGNIANRLGRKRKTEPAEIPVWNKQPQYEVFKGFSQDELLEQLVTQCGNIHTKVHISNREALQETFHEVVKELGGESIVHWNDPRFSEYGIEAALKKEEEQGVSIHQWNPEAGQKNIEIAERANIGITFSDITLAESATVVLFNDADKGRSVSLLPQTYVAIIPKSTLVPRMTQAAEYIHKMAEEKGTVPSCINFISGPSNSADIELRLVVGVHGPVKAHYIVIDDA